MVLTRTATSGPEGRFQGNPFAAILRGEGSPTLGLGQEFRGGPNLDFNLGTETGISPIAGSTSSGGINTLEALGIGGAGLGSLAALSKMLQESPEFEPGDDDFDLSAGLDAINTGKSIFSGISKASDLLGLGTSAASAGGLGGLTLAGAGPGLAESLTLLGAGINPLSISSALSGATAAAGGGLAGTGLGAGALAAVSPAAFLALPLVSALAVQAINAPGKATRAAQKKEIAEFSAPTSRFLNDAGIGKIAGSTGMTNKFGHALASLGISQRGPIHESVARKIGGLSGEENANVAVFRNVDALAGLGLRDEEFNKDFNAFGKGMISQSAFARSAKQAMARFKGSDEGQRLADEAESRAFSRALNAGGGSLNIPEGVFIPPEFQGFEEDITPGD